MNPVTTGLFGFFAGMAVYMFLVEWLAKRRLRCEVCGSETTPDGIGASAALGDDMENWGRDR